MSVQESRPIRSHSSHHPETVGPENLDYGCGREAAICEMFETAMCSIYDIESPIQSCRKRDFDQMNNNQNLDDSIDSDDDDDKYWLTPNLEGVITSDSSFSCVSEQATKVRKIDNQDYLNDSINDLISIQNELNEAKNLEDIIQIIPGLYDLQIDLTNKFKEKILSKTDIDRTKEHVKNCRRALYLKLNSNKTEHRQKYLDENFPEVLYDGYIFYSEYCIENGNADIKEIQRLYQALKSDIRYEQDQNLFWDEGLQKISSFLESRSVADEAFSYLTI